MQWVCLLTLMLVLQALDPFSSRGLHYSLEVQGSLRKVTLYSLSARPKAQQQLPMDAVRQHYNLSRYFLLAKVPRLHWHRARC